MQSVRELFRRVSGLRATEAPPPPVEVLIQADKPKNIEELATTVTASQIVFKPSSEIVNGSHPNCRLHIEDEGGLNPREFARVEKGFTFSAGGKKITVGEFGKAAQGNSGEIPFVKLTYPR